MASKYAEIEVSIKCLACGYSGTVPPYSDIIKAGMSGGCESCEYAYIEVECPNCKGAMDLS